MCRKVALTGWVLMIPADFEQARVFVALLVTITFLSLQLSVRPFLRCAALHFTATQHAAA